MKRFSIGVTLTCPSDWTEQKAREYVERIAVTEEERATLSVTEVPCAPSK